MRCRFEHHLAGAALSSGDASRQLGEVTVRGCAGPAVCIVCRNNREDHKPTCRSRQFGEEEEDVGEAACVCVCVYVRAKESWLNAHCEDSATESSRCEKEGGNLSSDIENRKRKLLEEEC